LKSCNEDKSLLVLSQVGILAMKEVLRTTDPVLLSYFLSILAGEGIEAVVLDTYMSTVFIGSIGALPQRVMVSDPDFIQAQLLVAETQANDG
jgi:hypothetical protein